MLRLVGEFTIATCPTCNGSGKVPCGRHMGVRTLNGGRPIDTPGEGRPMPCPMCNGSKVVTSDQLALPGRRT